MPAQKQDKPIHIDCKVVSQNNQYLLTGTFQSRLDIDPTLNELDQIEAEKKETLIPSAIAWKTSKHTHLTAGVIDTACKESQQVSYRKSSRNLAEHAELDSLISATTVWNKKQQRGKDLKSKQKALVEKIMERYEPTLVEHHLLPTTVAPTAEEESNEFSFTPEQEEEIDELIESFVRNGTTPVVTPKRESAIEDIESTLENPVSEVSRGMILIQLDEVVTKSQETNRKTNRTYTAAVENGLGEVSHLVAESADMLIRLIGVELVMFGLFAGKRLEVLGDGARWIGNWAKGITGIEVVTILCWYHLRKRRGRSGSVKFWDTFGEANIFWRCGSCGSFAVRRGMRSGSTI